MKEEMSVVPFVTTTEMFRKAYEGGYAIGAFNANNMEISPGYYRGRQRVPCPCDHPGLSQRNALCQRHLSGQDG